MPTPQAFLDELRIALPTLRHALESEHEWEHVLSETWKQLIAAARCTCYHTWKHPTVPFRFVGPGMLHFPVSLLTATALMEAIKRVIRRRLSLAKSNAPAESLNSTYDGRMKHAAPGVPPQGIILEHESSDRRELGILRDTSAVFEDIREVLGLSTVKYCMLGWFFCILTHLRRRPMSVRNGSRWCDRLQKSQFARSTSRRRLSSKVATSWARTTVQ
jgi:hypothetical protein